MAVDAVACVVLQKLRDLISEGSFTRNKIIETQLREMQEGLEKMRGFFIDAAEKETNVEDIKKWTDDYLQNLYYVEDTIESFALRITRQRKRLGFLMNYALFLKNFTACKRLNWKLEKIQKKIQKLNSGTPAGVEDASLRSIRSLQSDDDMSMSFNRWRDSETLGKKEEVEVMEKKNEEKREEMDSFFGFETDDPRSNARHSISSGSTISNTEGSKRSLLSSRSMKMRSYSDASLIRERWQHSKLMFNYSYNEKELEIVGFKCDVSDLLSRLTEEEYGGEQKISIVGELGSGKTVLTRAVYGNRIIKNWFDTCAWVTIFEESKIENLLLNLLKQVEKSEEQGGANSEELLKSRLQHHLKNKRYLIVLDGIRSIDQWESLKDAFPDDNKNGSKIIFTTRHELPDLKSTPYYLKQLDCEESWNLFLNKVGLPEGPEGPEGSILKHKLFEVCHGLPLNIVLLGSLLSTKRENGYGEWNSILDSLDNCQTSDILGLSYNDLDAHLKLCLLYLMLFPKEFDIPVRRLQRLWLAEGFVKRPPFQDRFQEDVVQEYFDNLVKRSLILVSKLRSDGSPRKCRLLGVLHDFWIDKAQDISLFHIHHYSVCREEADGPLGKRRLIEYTDAKNCSLSYSQYQNLRSYISFNVQKKDTPAKYVENFLSNVIGKGFGLLRVLDLEGVYKPGLPDNLGDLFHLRYLGLRWTFLDKLPKSVGCLPFLETLDLKHTFINRIPPSIWKLKHLRHLNLNEVRLDKDMPLHSRRSFPQLLTLWGLSVDHESPIKNGLSKLTQLRELGISFRLSQCDDESSDMKNGLSTDAHFTADLVDWITNLTSLQSLRLRSKDDKGCPSQLNLKPFSGLDKLSHMNLLGQLQKLPDLSHFPPNIRVLTLSVSRLNKDPMPILGQLQSLTVLRLLANSYLGDNIRCPSGTFRELWVLKLWMLNDLEKWVLEEGAMEKLKELNVRCCSKLENIPSRLFQHRTFKDLIITNMPEEFKRHAKMENFSNGHNVSIAVKNYEFTPLPWEEEDDFANGVASNNHNYPNGEYKNNIVQ